MSGMDTFYTHSRFQARRWRTRAVNVGRVGVGGDNPVRVQSMTTTPTKDVAATVAQCIALAEVGCEVVRITANSQGAARALKDIRREFSAAGFSEVPLVADIHFLPKAALEAVEHIEKVRVNPGNYADRKVFAQREYSDNEYGNELERLHDAFTPLVLRCKELGRAMRIGTNHGSLSDRIMNRYGDTPLGMVESALEFIRIAESHGYHDMILSMKASNPKVMLEAYRLAVHKMKEEGMAYPLHLGVTEAGDGEDARIKSAMGIGGLLMDGLGDTIRVSLTEDPVHEIPVALELAKKAMQLWEATEADAAIDKDQPFGWLEEPSDGVDPYTYAKRAVRPIDLGREALIGPLEPPRVIAKAPCSVADVDTLKKEVWLAQSRLRDARIEGLLLPIEDEEDLAALPTLMDALNDSVSAFVLEPGEGLSDAQKQELLRLPVPAPTGLLHVLPLSSLSADTLTEAVETARQIGSLLVLDATPSDLLSAEHTLRELGPRQVAFTCSAPEPSSHPLGTYRAFADLLTRWELSAPLWIRNTPANAVQPQGWYSDWLHEASILTGTLLCDGLGDIVSVETVDDLQRATTLAYNILQGARARSTKTEYVACPSCGRTLFDLESTTQRIRGRTGHLKGVTIAVMGCIVNGPGEMADADFGYVGGAPGKVNLYVGKQCVQTGIPSADAVDRLVDLIAEHGKWVEPEAESVEV